MVEERGGKLYSTDDRYCIDNGAMIAWPGLLAFKHGQVRRTLLGLHSGHLGCSSLLGRGGRDGGLGRYVAAAVGPKRCGPASLAWPPYMHL